jgi:hypothetical protein
MTKKACTHCWHPHLEESDTFSGHGRTIELCCWCGAFRRRRWRLERDPAHGQYAERSVRVYEE